MTDSERNAKVEKGLAAWKDWMEKHKQAIVYEGGPLGKTKRVSQNGITDVSNDLAVFIVVQAPSHEAAARMFEGHPHFTIFPGESAEVMPLLPVPEAH